MHADVCYMLDLVAAEQKTSVVEYAVRNKSTYNIKCKRTCVYLCALVYIYIHTYIHIYLHKKYVYVYDICHIRRGGAKD